MSKKVLEMLNHFREWNGEWERYDKGISKKIPMCANDFAIYIKEVYNIKDNE